MCLQAKNQNRRLALHEQGCSEWNQIGCASIEVVHDVWLIGKLWFGKWGVVILNENQVQCGESL